MLPEINLLLLRMMVCLRSKVWLCGLLSLVSYAQSPIEARLDSAAAPILYVASSAFENPAVRQWQMDVSISDVDVSYAHVDNVVSQGANPQLGSGEGVFSAGAQSYMKYKSSTLWGGASYDNGKQYDVVYNETADIGLIYPYVAADTIGGDIKLERYSFYGGYADHSGRWSWGGELRYTAGLYYRNVDPRPRNVTGLLDVKIGVGYRLLADYDLSAAFTLRRYTQSNDIDFKSEMGVDKIYHLTGLGNHYNRFAGLGLNAHYGGYRYGGILTLFPRGRKGVFATAEISRFSFDKVLRDLNELPMASVVHTRFSGQIGWLHPSRNADWAVIADFGTYRRHGTENIFGDPSSNIYPQIASLMMYADNAYSYSLSVLYCYKWGGYRMWMAPNAGYYHRRQIYRHPAEQSLDEIMDASALMGFSSLCGKWWLRLTARYSYTEHIGSGFDASVSVSRAVTDVVALRLSGGYEYDKLCRNLNVSFGVLF